MTSPARCLSAEETELGQRRRNLAREHGGGDRVDIRLRP